MRTYFLLMFAASIQCVFLKHASAQNSTISPTTNEDSLFRYFYSKDNIVLIPYLDHLYHSELDKEFAIHNPHYNISYIRAFIKRELINELERQLLLGHAPNILNPYRAYSDSLASLTPIYKNVQYVWIDKSQPQIKEKRTVFGELKDLKAKKDQVQLLGFQSYILNGQIIDERVNIDKFMSSTITEHDNLLQFRNKNNITAYFFINQIDLLYTYKSDQPYLLNIHFSYLDANFQEKKSGVFGFCFSNKTMQLIDFKTYVLSPLVQTVLNKW